MLVEVGGNWEAWLREQKEEQVKLVEQLKQEVSVTSEKLKKAEDELARQASELSALNIQLKAEVKELESELGRMKTESGTNFEVERKSKTCVIVQQEVKMQKTTSTSNVKLIEVEGRADSLEKEFYEKNFRVQEKGGGGFEEHRLQIGGGEEQGGGQEET